jgi:hypothetical protein
LKTEDEVYIKLELNKGKDQNLSIITYFSLNSPNFYKDGDFFIWEPTLEEKNFITDAFNLLIQNTEIKNNREKIFKFSDKLSNNQDLNKNRNKDDLNSERLEDEKEMENKNILSHDEQNYKDFDKESFNEKEKSILKDEQEKKIEKILKENKREV